MRFDVVRPEELGEQELARWSELRPANPFLSPEFALAVGRFRPEARVAMLSDGTGIAGFFPFERHPLGVGRPIGSGLTDCQGFIGPRDLEFDPRQLLRACGLKLWSFDHLLAEQSAFAPFFVETRTEPFMDLRNGFGSYVEQVRQSSHRLIQNTKRKERKLAREIGELSFTFSERDPAELRRLMVWKSEQYQRTGRVDRFAKPWITALVDHLHETGGCVLSVLRAGDRPVTLHLTVRYGDQLASWFPVYDPELAMYSPGLTAHLRLAEGAAANGITRIALGRGGRVYKERLKNGEFRIAEGRVARLSTVAGVQWVREAPVRRLRSVVLANPGLYRQADRVLKSYAWLRTRVVLSR